ncbi:F-box protein At4g00755-like isoform X3 [Trifolium pratense]|uniref:F-box protein At4g00755-like isoform X3 n=1 Tax=Trifolium pratense TaxID=57577 RepID=UPI001E69063A|nr:F-box protein At4g00755-like isoform X3 [Trifolium pratense]
MSSMKTNMDFIQWLGPDLSIKVFSCLDDPGDLVRVSAVCSSWEHFVIENGLCKQLCLKMIPEVSGVVPSIEYYMIEPDSDKRKHYYTKWDCLKRNHKLYAHLAFGFTPMKKNCIEHFIKGIANTLEPRDETENGPPHETLVYRLCSNLCLVTEINVQPFQAYYDSGLPMYTTKAIRIRLGYRRRGEEIGSMTAVDDSLTFCRKYEWRYTSPIFPMSQENKLQTFKLPEPVLCIGGAVLVELFVRRQQENVDNFLYSWIRWFDRLSPFEVVGKAVSPEFIVRIHQFGSTNERQGVNE